MNKTLREAMARVDEADVSGEDMADSSAEAAEALSAESAEDAEMGDAEAPAEPRHRTMDACHAAHHRIV